MDKVVDDSHISLVEIMLELVRSAVLNRNPIIPQNVEIDWDKLMDIAVTQDVVALVWDGICKLPEEDKPPRNQLISWGLSAEETYRAYFSQEKVLKSLIDTCEKYSMRLLLLKGFGLSSLYPHPQARSCADIDIFLFDDYEKGNLIWNTYLVDKKGKHSSLKFGEVLVENHNSFLDQNTPQKKKIVEYLYSTIDRVLLTPEGYYVFEPMSNLLFLVFHTLKHFHEGTMIPIRNIIDLALFIQANKKSLIPIECDKLLKKMHLRKSFELLIVLSEWIIDMDFKEYHFYKMPVDDMYLIKQELLSDVSRYVEQGGQNMAPSQINQFISKLSFAGYIPRNYSYKQLYLPRIISWLKSWKRV